nr:MAG TPA: hypothetical protein [Caudoviricetes sp.]
MQSNFNVAPINYPYLTEPYRALPDTTEQDRTAPH